ncbi:DUF6114 domain-containing protein [Streptomyces pactum]|uniref:DUF6114 domain-containing protein n=1 Tax=Streptomyces pactum TaxID=68249 RepID=UPI0036FA6A87
MSAVSPGARVNRLTSWRLSFRAWRWQRPFWAGLLTLLAGVPIAYFPYANLTMGQLTIRMATTTGSASLIIGVLLMVLGVSMWFQPAVRVFAGVAAILLGLVSLVVSNFGGFLMGFLLALFGGGMSTAWAPGVAEPMEGPAEPAARGTGAPAAAASAPSPEPAPATEAVPSTEPARTAVAVETAGGPDLVKRAPDPVAPPSPAEAGTVTAAGRKSAPRPDAAGTAADRDTTEGRHRAR